MASIRNKVLIFILIVCLFLSQIDFSLGWANGGGDEGKGIGTHDFILQQALAKVKLDKNADLSWFDETKATEFTSYPDYHRGACSVYSYTHAYFGRGSNYQPIYGEAPLGVSKLYRELLVHIKKGEKSLASKKLGILSHLIGDLSSMFHIKGTGKYFAGKRYIDYHNTHELSELEFDYYLRCTILKKVSMWPADVKRFAKFNPALLKLTDESTIEEKRISWFGGELTKTKKSSLSARQLAINLAGGLRNKYGNSFMRIFGKVCKKGVMAGEHGKMPYRGEATKFTFQTMPKFISASSDALASIIYDLSIPTRRSIGLDNIKIRATTSKTKYFKVKKSYYGRVIYTVVVRKTDANGKVISDLSSLGSIPVAIKITLNKKVTYYKRLYTDNTGKIRIALDTKRGKKIKKLTFDVVSLTALKKNNVTLKKTLPKIKKKKKKTIKKK